MKTKIIFWCTLVACSSFAHAGVIPDEDLTTAGTTPSYESEKAEVLAQEGISQQIPLVHFNDALNVEEETQTQTSQEQSTERREEITDQETTLSHQEYSENHKEVVDLDHSKIPDLLHLDQERLEHEKENPLNDPESLVVQKSSHIASEENSHNFDLEIDVFEDRHPHGVHDQDSQEDDRSGETGETTEHLVARISEHLSDDVDQQGDAILSDAIHWRVSDPKGEDDVIYAQVEHLPHQGSIVKAANDTESSSSAPPDESSSSSSTDSTSESSSSTAASDSSSDASSSSTVADSSSTDSSSTSSSNSTTSSPSNSTEDGSSTSSSSTDGTSSDGTTQASNGTSTTEGTTQASNGTSTDVTTSNSTVSETTTEGSDTSDTTTETTTTKKPPKKKPPYNAVLNCRCGTQTTKRLEVGQVKVDTNVHPWTVMINNTQGRLCSGNIINSKFIITSASCLRGQSIREITIKAALTMRNRTVKFTPEKINIHPAYNHNTQENNIALLEVKETIRPSKTVKFICLPISDDNTNSTGTLVTLSTDPSSRQVVLYTEQVKQISNRRCSTLAKRTISKNTFCSAPPSRHCDETGGDGGAYIIPGKGYSFTIKGLVSSAGCKRKSKPAVYTKAEKYINWILHKTKHAQYCKAPSYRRELANLAASPE